MITHIYIYILYTIIYLHNHTSASACAEVSELRDIPASPASPLPKGGALGALRFARM